VYLIDSYAIARASLAERLSWVSRRKTTREEDLAYCLFGIFDVQISLLYGEGGEKAFVRLQEEIVRRTTDQSLFAWGFLGVSGRSPLNPVFASEPNQFMRCASITSKEMKQPPFQITNKGLQITMDLVEAKNDLMYGFLDCVAAGSDLALPLTPIRHRRTGSFQDGENSPWYPVGYLYSWTRRRS